MSGLTTHVLDLTAGRPAAGVAVRLSVRTGEAWTGIFATRTDGDGRAKLIPDKAFTATSYRLEFDIGDHFRASGATSGEPGFLETVAIEFTVADPARRHHIPLLVSPFGYSTYRGS